jgi:hypothetical protein
MDDALHDRLKRLEQFHLDQSKLNGSIDSSLKTIIATLKELQDSAKSDSIVLGDTYRQAKTTNGRVTNHDADLELLDNKLNEKADKSDIDKLIKKIDDYIDSQKKTDMEQTSAIQTLQNKDLKMSTVVWTVGLIISAAWAVLSFISKYF